MHAFRINLAICHFALYGLYLYDWNAKYNMSSIFFMTMIILMTMIIITLYMKILMKQSGTRWVFYFIFKPKFIFYYLLSFFCFFVFHWFFYLSFVVQLVVTHCDSWYYSLPFVVTCCCVVPFVYFFINDPKSRYITKAFLYKSVEALHLQN